MKLPPFRYCAPTSVEGAIEVLASDEDGRPLAGGQSLLPLMALRLSTPSTLVDLTRAEGLAELSASGDVVTIGAMVRQAACECSPLVARKLPLLRQALTFVAHAAIRNRGTIGGSLSHADAAAELPTVMTALDATMRVRGPAGERAVHARDFFVGHFSSALRGGEILTAVDVPDSPLRWRFAEVCRRHGDFALVLVAVGLRMDADRCVDARIVLGGVADRPVRAPDAEAMLAAGVPVDRECAHEAAEMAAADLSPPADVHASSRVRTHLARVLVERTVLEVAGAGR